MPALPQGICVRNGERYTDEEIKSHFLRLRARAGQMKKGVGNFVECQFGNSQHVGCLQNPSGLHINSGKDIHVSKLAILRTSQLCLVAWLAS